MKYHIRKTAFTLAEVLITLGIIGVVAALTIPSLISKKHNSELEVALKKYYSVLQQVCLQMYLDEGQTINRLNYTGEEFLLKFKKYFISVNNNRLNVSTENNEETGDSILTLKEYRTFNKKMLFAGYLDDGSINIGNDIMIFLERPASGERMLITIDVNGINKGPNLWGHDMFTFQVMDDGRLLPMGAEGTELTDENALCSKESNSASNGIACTYRALTDKTFWDNL